MKNNIKVHGVGNRVICSDGAWNAKIRIYGNNNTVIIEDVPPLGALTVLIGFKGFVECNNCVVRIGKGTTLVGCEIQICEDNTNVEIGEDCMLSRNIIIYASDTHTVLDAAGNVTNIGRHIKIGNHVWIGHMG